MFTGIIESLGEVLSLSRQAEGARLVIRAELAQPSLGESICVDGACLTLAAFGQASLEFDLSHETLQRTSLGACKPGQRVNLERALKVGDTLGGHMVAGHIDCMGSLKSAQGEEYVFQAPADFMSWVASKGSVAINGVSLTPVKVDQLSFSVALIPHTLQATNLGALMPGQAVNLEADTIARYVRRAMEAGQP